MPSPPGTSPTPVWPALSRTITILRVKYGPWAPDRFISMLSCPATGTTVSSVTTGVWADAMGAAVGVISGLSPAFLMAGAVSFTPTIVSRMLSVIV